MTYIHKGPVAMFIQISPDAIKAEMEKSVPDKRGRDRKSHTI